MATFKEALQFAQQNPNTEFANEFRRRIESGQLDQDALKEGVNLSNLRSGKPTVNQPLEFLKGGAKGALSTVFSVPKKVSQIAEISAKKNLIESSQKGISNIEAVNQRIREALNLMPSTDPRRKDLENALKSSISTQQGISGNLPQDLTNQTEKNLSFLNPNSTAQKAGYTAEKIAEFFIPSGKVVTGLENAVLKQGEALSANVDKLSVGGRLIEKISRPFTKLRQAKEAGALNALGNATETGLRTAFRSVLEGGNAAITSAAQGQDYNDIKTSALVAAAFPAVGSVLNGFKETIKSGTGKLGKAIQFKVLRPIQSEIEDGFKIENISKYDLGGSLAQTLSKGQIKINQYSEELNNLLKSSESKVNLNEAFNETMDFFSDKKFENFGNTQSIKRVIDGLKNEIKDASEDGLVGLSQANLVKRGAGTKGSWVFGSADPDATAIEKVYTKFYQILKTKIEQAIPNGKVKEVNKKISELIPIVNAAIRRLPQEQKRAVLSATDNLGLFASFLDPKALLLVGANKLSKSGRFGNFLAKLAESQPNRGATRQRIFGLNNIVSQK